MTYEIFKVFPLDRDDPVVELNVVTDDRVSIPLRVSREAGALSVTIFGIDGGAAWELDLERLLDALQRASVALA